MPIVKGAVEKKNVPILVIESRVLLPGGMLRLNIGKPSSVSLVQHVCGRGTRRPLLGILTSRRTAATTDEEEEEEEELKGRIGTLAHVIRCIEVEDDDFTFSLVVRGATRFRVREITARVPHLSARVTTLSDQPVPPRHEPALAKTVRGLRRALDELVAMFKSNRKAPMVATLRELLDTVAGSSPAALADLVISTVEVPVEERLAALEELGVIPRVELALTVLKRQLEALRLTAEIEGNVEAKLRKHQRQFILKSKLEEIKEALRREENGSAQGGDESARGAGSGSRSAPPDDVDEIAEIEASLVEANLPPVARKAAERELRRLKRMQPTHPEFHVIRSYLELMAEMPWGKRDGEAIDIAKARKILDADHCGLQLVKRRILEFLAVQWCARRVGRGAAGSSTTAEQLTDAEAAAPSEAEEEEETSTAVRLYIYIYFMLECD